MRTIVKAIAAAACVAATQAGAVELAGVNAFACGVDPAQTSRASYAVGSRYERGGWSAFASGVDPRAPSMVKLSMIYDRGSFVEIEHCGGAVIDSRTIVTAAHCVSGPDGEKWDRIEIHAGDAKLGGASAISRVSYDVVCHAGFDYSLLANDIALVRLREPLPREVVPAQMDEFRRPSVREGALATAAGWPITGQRKGAQTLQVTRLSVRDVEWPGYITVSSPHGGTDGVCRGESGGPLMGVDRNGRPSLAGVLSGIEPGTEDRYGEPCMKPGYEMYYTPIAAYRDWIDEVRRVCDHYPSSCRGRGPSSFFLAQSQPQPGYRGAARASLHQRAHRLFGRYAAAHRARY